jgi:hypothetical protein
MLCQESGLNFKQHRNDPSQAEHLMEKKSTFFSSRIFYNVVAMPKLVHDHMEGIITDWW